MSTTLSELIRSGNAQIGFVVSPDREQIDVLAENIDEERESFVCPLWTHHFELRVTLLVPS